MTTCPIERNKLISKGINKNNNVCKMILFNSCIIAIIILSLSCKLSYATVVTVTYDITNANRYNGALSPNVSLPGVIAASSLHPNNLSVSSQTSLIPTTGIYIFQGWNSGVNGSTLNRYLQPNFEFSVTSNTLSFQPKDITYTYWTANYSDIWFGPDHVEVWASTDNFATGSLVASHYIGQIAYSKGPYSSNIFTDDLSSLDYVQTGQTLSMRFIAYGYQYGYPFSALKDNMAGFTSYGGTNVVFDATVPEPSTYILLSIALGAVGFARWKIYKLA